MRPGKPSSATSSPPLRLLPNVRRAGWLRRLRRLGLWDRLLELPWLWAALLVLLGGAALAPGAFLLGPLLAPRPAPGAVAGRDYIASRDLLVHDDAATRAKRQQAADRVLPVYDFDPGLEALRDAQLARLFAAGRQRLPAARGEAAREALARDLAGEAARAALPPPAAGSAGVPAGAAVGGPKGSAAAAPSSGATPGAGARPPAALAPAPAAKRVPARAAAAVAPAAPASAAATKAALASASVSAPVSGSAPAPASALTPASGYASAPASALAPAAGYASAPASGSAPAPASDSALASASGSALVPDSPPASAQPPALAAGPGTLGGGPLEITPEQVLVLLRMGFSPETEDRLRGILDETLRRGVVENKAQLLGSRLTGIVLRNLGDGSERVQVNLFDHLGYPEETRDLLESELRGWGGLAAGDRRRLAAFLLANVGPNLHLDHGETLARRAAAEEGAGDVYTQVRKGQVIARKGDVIDEDRARLLAQMRGQSPSRSRWPEVLGTFLLAALAAAALWLALAGERVADHSRRRLFGESALLLAAALLAARLGFLLASALAAAFQVPPFDAWRAYALALPFAALPLSAALLLRRHVALVLALLSSVLAGRMAVEGEPLAIAVYALAGSLAAIFAVDRLQLRQRLVLPRAGLVVGGTNVVLALVLSALAGPEGSLLTVAFELVSAFAGGLLAAAVASFAVPVLEPVLGIATDIKLLELSNTNLPLLRRLAFEAPGTFQHSLMVANLAKEGCEAIGADAVLAYAAALYHDLGKVFRPDYFIENQRPGQNRHDRLLPSMSVLILVSHVKEGAELARQGHLPKVIVDAIEQHHGTRLMRFFYNRALEQRDRDGREVREGDYRYPGPRPRNKVMGVLMLADGVEAASRTLVDPTPAKLRGLIRTLFDDCLQDGQLDKTDLTLGDLAAVSEAFLRVLSTIYHHRIDYPGFDFNAVAGAKRERRPAPGAVRVS